MSVEINVHEAKTRLSRLLERQWLVRPAPVETAPTRRKPGTANGVFVVPDDFDAPLPEEILSEFER